MADDQSKKRKREEQPNAHDPKLQEYLRVMKSGREEAGVEDPTQFEANFGLPTPGADIPEEESDDEYEQIPNRKEKQRKLEASSSQPQAHSAVEPPHSTKANTSSMDIDGESSEKPQQDIAVIEATDDDWLRSRTNRTLDFVDPEDLQISATPHSIAQPEEQTTQSIVNETTVEPEGIEDVAGRRPEMDGKGQESLEDVIRRTSRLFVRNLAYHATEDEISEEFSKFGELLEVRLNLFSVTN